ncbi:MAG: chlorophyll synthase ChlG [Pseudomonadota bacterium]
MIHGTATDLSEVPTGAQHAPPSVEASAHATAHALPQPSAILELFKPITWFPPMWAFACGAVASGVVWADHLWTIVIGILLAGPMVCATSQAVNDWFDRHVDAINEPNRPIPSGRIPGRWGLWIAIAWTICSLAVASLLGTWVFVAAILGLALAWAYSAPPLRFKQNGWIGNAACGFSYEGLAWFTGTAVLVSAFPDWRSITLAVLYSIGAHGIMTLNDYKAIDGDEQLGVNSLPVLLGPERAAQVACAVMIAPQLVVVAFLLAVGAPWHAAAIAALVIIQLTMMRRFLARPVERALWYSASGVPVFVAGMMVAAFAVRPLVAAAGGS